MFKFICVCDGCGKTEQSESRSVYDLRIPDGWFSDVSVRVITNASGARGRILVEPLACSAACIKKTVIRTFEQLDEDAFK